MYKVLIQHYFGYNDVVKIKHAPDFKSYFCLTQNLLNYAAKN